MITDNEYFEITEDPYFTVKDVLDTANWKIQNINESKIPLGQQINIIRLVLNDYGLNSNTRLKVFEKSTVIGQDTYTIDIPNFRKIHKLYLNEIDITSFYLNRVLFDATDETTLNTATETVYTIQKTGSFFNQIKFKPAPTAIVTLRVEYFSANNEPITNVKDYVTIPNQFYTYFIDSVIYSFIKWLPSTDQFKQEEKAYYMRHTEALRLTRAGNEDANSNNVSSIVYMKVPNSDCIQD